MAASTATDNAASPSPAASASGASARRRRLGPGRRASPRRHDRRMCPPPSRLPRPRRSRRFVFLSSVIGQRMQATGLIGGPAVIPLWSMAAAARARPFPPSEIARAPDPTPPDPTQLRARGTVRVRHPTSAADGWRSAGFLSSAPRCITGGLESRRQVGPELARRPRGRREGVRGPPRPARAHRMAARRSVPRRGRCRASRYPTAPRRAPPRPAPGWRTRRTPASPPRSPPRPRRSRRRAAPRVGHACLAVVVGSIRMFAGLMSRCTMPCSWANWSSGPLRGVDADAHGEPEWQSWRYRAMIFCRSGPSTRLMTMKSPLTSSVPVSWIVTMFGWRSAAAFRASRRNCSTNASSSAYAGRRTLTATSRAQHLVVCPIHDGHPALTEDLEQAIAAGEHTSRHHPPTPHSGPPKCRSAASSGPRASSRRGCIALHSTHDEPSTRQAGPPSRRDRRRRLRRPVRGPEPGPRPESR